MDDIKLANIVAVVKTHAQANYEKGWDFVVECYGDADIVEELVEHGAHTSESAAIAYFEQRAAIRADRRADIMAEVF